MERRDSVVAASSSKKDPAPPLVAPSCLARATIKVRVRRRREMEINETKHLKS
jgi:hypothetical protein